MRFVHQNVPAQFGPFAVRLARTPGWRGPFVSNTAAGAYRGVDCIKSDPPVVHEFSRSFVTAPWHTAIGHAVRAAGASLVAAIIPRRV